MAAKLFTPITLGGVTLPNRIVVSPMCQYSADDGSMNDWHFVHLGHLAYSGAGLVMVEATHVTREGRITHGCTGLYSDHNEASIKKVIDACRRLSRSPIGIQIGHAGRKASTQVPWEGREALGPHESPWPTVAPSALPFSETWHTPRELTRAEIPALVDAFVHSAQRARRIGFDVLELHSAHGYLLHQFLSPLSNRRRDDYGRERMIFPRSRRWSMPLSTPHKEQGGSVSTCSSCTRRTATSCTSSCRRSPTAAATTTGASA